MANIPPCVALTQYLLQAEWKDGIAPKIMVYHSRQVLLLRHEQEKHLDRVLQRKEKAGEAPKAFKEPMIRRHLDDTDAGDVMFILVATPVEEVGRDHDFDWAIIEPSSSRSIIQLAGRVLRHRHLYADIEHANIAIMQYNLKALRQGNGPAYCRPGYENAKSLRLTSHDLCELVDEAVLNRAVNAIPRIQQPETLQSKQRLADLEHEALHKALTDYRQKGPQGLQAWLNENWWLTAVPQQINRFRAGKPETPLFLVWRNGEPEFCEKDERGEFIVRQALHKIVPAEALTADAQTRLWLARDYQTVLYHHAEAEPPNGDAGIDDIVQAKSERYGEIMLRPDSENRWFYSDQLGLFQEMS
jgi:CRISPR-associated endonuclease/helicase Cas3